MQLSLFPDLVPAVEIRNDVRHRCPFPGCTDSVGHRGGCRTHPPYREASDREKLVIRQFLEQMVRPLEDPRDAEKVAERDEALADLVARVAVQVPDIPDRFASLRTGTVEEDRAALWSVLEMAAVVHHLSAAREDAAWRERVAVMSLNKQVGLIEKRAEAWDAHARVLRKDSNRVTEAERLELLSRAWRAVAAAASKAWRPAGGEPGRGGA